MTPFDPAIIYGPSPAPAQEFDHMLAAFRAAVAEAGNRPALHYFDQAISYAQLDGQSQALASWLVAQGVVPGDRVMICLQNIPQFIMMVLAAWKLRAIPVPANPMYTPGELARLIRDAEPKAVLCLDHQLEEMLAAVEQAEMSTTVLATSPRSFQSLDDARVLPQPPMAAVAAPLLEDIVASPPADAVPEVEPQADDIGLILYTSGTTGTPKGAVLRQSSLAYNAQILASWCEIDADSILLALAPYFHITGFTCHIATAICARAAQVLHYRVEPSLMLDMIRRHRPTFAIGAITAFNALSNLADITSQDMASFHRIYSGGAPIPPALMADIERKLQIKIHSCYGMTETAAPTHLTPGMATIPVDAESGTLSIGVVQPGTQARVVDDNGADLPAGSVGELVVRGPQVMVGYWRKPEETAQTIKEGWLSTGDIAFMDANGWYYLVDRKKDVIIASGFKVWPREVEDVLYTFDAVREAAVVGEPDAYRGETVKAFVSLKPGASLDPAELQTYCRERLAAYKVPRMIEVMDELPKTVTGKIQRLALRR